MGRRRKYPAETAAHDALANWRGRLRREGIRAIYVYLNPASLARLRAFRDGLGRGSTYARAIETLLDEHDRNNEINENN